MKQEELEKLSEKEILIEIYKNTQATKRYILVGKVVNLIYILLIVVPLIWLAVLVKPMMSQFDGLMKGEMFNVNMTPGMEINADTIQQVKEAYGL